MAKALGIGGIFFKTEDPAGLAARYREWLSFSGSDEDYPYARFGWFIDPTGIRVELWKAPATNE